MSKYGWSADSKTDRELYEKYGPSVHQICQEEIEKAKERVRRILTRTADGKYVFTADHLTAEKLMDWVETGDGSRVAARCSACHHRELNPAGTAHCLQIVPTDKEPWSTVCGCTNKYHADA